MAGALSWSPQRDSAAHRDPLESGSFQSLVEMTDMTRDYLSSGQAAARRDEHDLSLG